MSEPTVVPYDDKGNRDALRAGKAVGPVRDDDEWAWKRCVR